MPKKPTTHQESKRSKKKTAKRTGAPIPPDPLHAQCSNTLDCVFLERLEELGLYEWGAPRGLRKLVACGTNEHIGWLHEFDPPFADEPPFWDVVEIVVPRHHLYLKALSDTADDPHEIGYDYQFREVEWKLGKRMVCTNMVWGDRQTWRRYSCKRETDNPPYLPWLAFTLGKTDPARLGVDEGFLMRFLSMAASSSADDAKLYRRILKFLCLADRDAFEEPIRTLFGECPSLRNRLHALLPHIYDEDDDIFKCGMTVKALADYCKVSQTTIRRAVDELASRPNSRRRPIVYSHAVCDEIKVFLATKAQQR